MEDKYGEIFEKLVKGYYNNQFEDTYHEIMNNDLKEEENPKEILLALCGVKESKAEKEHHFYQELVNGITNQRVRNKIVQKVRSCTSDCESVDGKSKCQTVCPFDAIVKDGEKGEKRINDELCMSCGRCVIACEKGNYLDTKEFLPALELLKENKEVFAMVAPAIAGQFGEDVTLDMLREAFISIGFRDMVEVALGADVLTVKEALEFDRHVEKPEDCMISSCCCPIWVAALKRVYNSLIKDVSPSVSPMIAMARILKKLNPGCKVVFVGPCIAKKQEAKEPDLIGDVDFVITFQELQEIFAALEVDVTKLKGLPTVEYAARGGRLYGRAGGVSQAVWDVVDQLLPEKRKLFTSIHVDGMKNCKDILTQLENGEKRATFIEGMACPGGCAGGPKRNIDVEKGTEAVNRFANDSEIKIPVHSEVMRELLYQIGVEDIKELAECAIFERKFE